MSWKHITLPNKVEYFYTGDKVLTEGIIHLLYNNFGKGGFYKFDNVRFDLKLISGLVHVSAMQFPPYWKKYSWFYKRSLELDEIYLKNKTDAALLKLIL